ncbi:MAG: HAD-IC family P-type ATPase [Halobacteria archaeon]|nr:HAD-IC family P-type ATPase [Halobacteria archaeon]
MTSAFLIGLTVLIVSCPCALGLATPLAIASGVRESLAKGIVIRDESLFERSGKDEAEVIALDKTGTLSTGEMTVIEACASDEAMRKAASVEQMSNHPVAEAITDHTSPTRTEVEDFENHRKGVTGLVNGEEVVVGHMDLFEKIGWDIPADLKERFVEAREKAVIPVLVGWSDEARDIALVGDKPRQDWSGFVDEVSKRADEIVIITGDSDKAAERFREHPEVDEVFAEVPPEAKAEVVRRLRSKGSVTMVGDGNNDAPALAAADLGVAMGKNALTADSADVVVTSEDLFDVIDVLRIAGKTRLRIKQNLGWAFLYNVVAIPLAIFGIINPFFAAIAMSASSLIVVANSSRSMVE